MARFVLSQGHMSNINPDKFTEKSIEALNGAGEIARERGNAEILQIHLLASLVAQEGGIVGALLNKIGSDKRAALELGIRRVLDSLPKISGSGIYNYSTMMQAELNTTYVHELAPLGKRIAEYIINTPPQAYSAELKWSKCPQIAYPNDVGTLSSSGVPNRFISPNNFTVNTTTLVPFTWIENQIYSIHGYTTGPVTITINGITTYTIAWAGEFNFTFITGSANTNPLTFTSTDSIIIAGLEIGTNSSQDLYTNAFYFMRPFSNPQNITPRTETEFVPGARLTEKGLEIKLSGFTSTAAIAQNAVICSLPFTIPGTCMFPAYNMTDNTTFVIGAYQGGNIWTLTEIPANKQFFILPGIYPFR